MGKGVGGELKTNCERKKKRKFESRVGKKKIPEKKIQLGKFPILYMLFRFYF